MQFLRNSSFRSLLTKNYTLYTIGTFISVVGSRIAGFAMGLLIFVETGSILQFALYLAASELPRIILPILVSPYIDRFPRKKTIILLDYLFAILFFLFFQYINQGFFNYPLVLAFSILINTIEAVYSMAYNSLFPDITPRNQIHRASVILGSLPFLANAVALPVAAWINSSMGVAVLLLINSITFFITATLEIFIQVKETLQESSHTKYSIKQYVDDLREGWNYLKNERPLQGISALYFTVMITAGLEMGSVLPYFIESPNLTTEMYANASGIGGFARFVTSLLLLVFTASIKNRQKVFFMLFFAGLAFSNVLLIVPYPFYIVFSALSLSTGMVTFSIRQASISLYVPGEKLGRFNAIFFGLATLGILIGYLLVGVIGTFLSLQIMYSLFHAITIVFAIGIVMYYKNSWSALFSTN